MTTPQIRSTYISDADALRGDRIALVESMLDDVLNSKEWKRLQASADICLATDGIELRQLQQIAGKLIVDLDLD